MAHVAARSWDSHPPATSVPGDPLQPSAMRGAVSQSRQLRAEPDPPRAPAVARLAPTQQLLRYQAWELSSLHPVKSVGVTEPGLGGGWEPGLLGSLLEGSLLVDWSKRGRGGNQDSWGLCWNWVWREEGGGS